MVEEKLYYRGKDVETLTKEELIEALKRITYLYNNTIENHQRDLNVLSMIRNLKK